MQVELLGICYECQAWFVNADRECLLRLGCCENGAGLLNVVVVSRRQQQGEECYCMWGGSSLVLRPQHPAGWHRLSAHHTWGGSEMCAFPSESMGRGPSNCLSEPHLNWGLILKWDMKMWTVSKCLRIFQWCVFLNTALNRLSAIASAAEEGPSFVEFVVHFINSTRFSTVIYTCPAWGFRNGGGGTIRISFWAARAIVIDEFWRMGRKGPWPCRGCCRRHVVALLDWRREVESSLRVSQPIM
jgi:hypothetical protein